MAQTLVELCEPLFLYVCRLNRTARELSARGERGKMDPDTIRRDVLRLMKSVQDACEKNRLGAEFESVKPDLCALVDDVIRKGPFEFNESWQPLSVELCMDVGWMTTFYHRLEELQSKPVTEGVLQRLGVSYQCLGLGFTGMMAQDPGRITRYLGEIAGKLDAPGAKVRTIDPDFTVPICPEVVETVDRNTYWKPGSNALWWAGWAVLGLFVVILVAIPFAYMSATGELKKHVGEINDSYKTWDEKAAKDRAK